MIEVTLTLQLDTDRVDLTPTEVKRAITRALDDRVVRDVSCITIGHTSDVVIHGYAVTS